MYIYIYKVGLDTSMGMNCPFFLILPVVVAVAAAAAVTAAVAAAAVAAAAVTAAVVTAAVVTAAAAAAAAAAFTAATKPNRARLCIAWSKSMIRSRTIFNRRFIITNAYTSSNTSLFTSTTIGTALTN